MNTILITVGITAVATCLLIALIAALVIKLKDRRAFEEVIYEWAKASPTCFEEMDNIYKIRDMEVQIALLKEQIEHQRGTIESKNNIIDKMSENLHQKISDNEFALIVNDYSKCLDGEYILQVKSGKTTYDFSVDLSKLENINTALNRVFSFKSCSDALMKNFYDNEQKENKYKFVVNYSHQRAKLDHAMIDSAAIMSFATTDLIDTKAIMDILYKSHKKTPIKIRNIEQIKE